MQLSDADRLLITPGLSLLCDVSGKPMDTPEARVMMVAIALQESRFKYRAQIGGPARCYFQFELMGGVLGVLTHSSSREYASQVCKRMDYESNRTIVYSSIADNGALAACFARLLLWTDPRALPRVDDPGAAWDTYIRNWRPGKPHPDTWPDLHAQARAHVESSPRGVAVHWKVAGDFA